ncbi:hypothetical protein ONZ43_g3558 [Nemania bipapillata]|uniref:Uncharacterized protein n=1 Tax=Nemania bipapillata TaxID=110536 RepID=A0ACC2IWG8_9PEZI|nr:hypothetical protein ONZ43_g3558 [Nemania bipapillata]
MGARKAPTKTILTNDANANDRRQVTDTPKRKMSSYRIRQKNSTPVHTDASLDELDTMVGAGDTEQAIAEDEDEEILDEIVVFGTPRNTTTKSIDSNSQPAVMRNPAQDSTMLRRSSRTSSTSQSGSSTLSPSGRGVKIKKQDFVVDIAADDDGKPDELSDVPTPKKRKVDVQPTRRVAFRKGRSKWDNEDEMLTDPNSPLVKAKLRELLCSPKAWDILTHEERERILAKFPDNAEILSPGTPDARPDIAALRNNNNFRHDVARYQEGLSKGFHDPEWVQQAQAAHRSRQLGFYDEFRATDFEEKWDMPMFQQAQAESEICRNNDDHVSEGQLNELSTEAKVIVSSEDVADHLQGTYNTPKPRSTEVSHGDTIEDSIQDKMDDLKGTNNSKDEPSSPTSRDEDKRDGSCETDAMEKSAQPQPETNQTSTESDVQEIGDSSQNTEIPNMPSFPSAMEGVEQQTEEGSEITQPQQVSIAITENPEAPLDVNTQPTIESAEIAEGALNESQQRRGEEDTQQKGKAAEHPPNVKSEM